MPDFTFTLAHELGHFALHRNTEIPVEYTQVRDEVRDVVTARKLLETPRERVEYQANRFASALLMPKPRLAAVVMAAVERVTGTPGRRRIHINLEHRSEIEATRIIREVARRYGVSMSVARNRLTEMGHLVAHGYASVTHVSKLLGIRPPLRRVAPRPISVSSSRLEHVSAAVGRTG